jgi:hypothetical protein
MTWQLGVATFVGGFLFPFLIRMLWDLFVEKYDVIGGALAATFIVGLMWAVNHGLETPFIHQTGGWIDMGFAAGVGVWTATVTKGASAGKSGSTVLAAIVAGILGGWIVSLFL